MITRLNYSLNAAMKILMQRVDAGGYNDNTCTVIVGHLATFADHVSC